MRARKRRRPSKLLKADASLLPDPPPATWREVVRRPSFRASLLRQSVPVVGVLALGWPALDVALFFLLDVWLYLSVRAGCEITFDPRYAGTYLGGRRTALDFAKNAAVAALVLGLLVGFAGWLSVGVAAPPHEWAAFVGGGYRDPVFLLALVFLVSSHLWEGVRFVERVRSRTEDERRQDTLAVRVMAARLLVVGAAPVWLAMGAAVGQGGRLLVLLIAGAVLWLEAFPDRANRLLGFRPGGEYA